MIDDLKGDESWRIFRIISEFTEGFDSGFTILIFDSARTDADDHYYQKTVEIAQRLAQEDFSIISGTVLASWLPPTKAPLNKARYLSA